jgi:hypothetical protein
MNYEDVPLTNGRVVRVYAPPIIKINNILQKRYPAPQVPIKEAPTAGGGTLAMAIEDDPQYLQDMEAHEELITEKTVELNILFALKDERVPDDFDATVYQEIIELHDEEWKPREGKAGRKLDWFDFDLLGNIVDSNRVQTAMNNLISIDLEVTEQVEDSFSGDVEGDSITPVAESG